MAQTKFHLTSEIDQESLLHSDFLLYALLQSLFSNYVDNLFSFSHKTIIIYDKGIKFENNYGN